MEHFKAAAVKKKLTFESLFLRSHFFFLFVSQSQEMRTFFWLSVPESHLYIYIHLYIKICENIWRCLFQRGTCFVLECLSFKCLYKLGCFQNFPYFSSYKDMYVSLRKAKGSVLIT